MSHSRHNLVQQVHILDAESVVTAMIRESEPTKKYYHFSTKKEADDALSSIRNALTQGYKVLGLTLTEDDLPKKVTTVQGYSHKHCFWLTEDQHGMLCGINEIFCSTSTQRQTKTITPDNEESKLPPLITLASLSSKKSVIKPFCAYTEAMEKVWAHCVDRLSTTTFPEFVNTVQATMQHEAKTPYVESKEAKPRSESKPENGLFDALTQIAIQESLAMPAPTELKEEAPEIIKSKVSTYSGKFFQLEKGLIGNNGLSDEKNPIVNTRIYTKPTPHTEDPAQRAKQLKENTEQRSLMHIALFTSGNKANNWDEDKELYMESMWLGR